MADGQPDRDRIQALSQRERDCLRLVLDQMSSKEIGRSLGISPTSVDTHVRRARAKLGVDDRYVAAQLLADWERGGAVAAAATPARAANRSWALPPLASLGLPQRLMLVLLGAVIGAIAFGAVLSALAAL